MIEPLDAIGLRCGTLKSSSHHDYLSTYDEFFGHLRSEPVSILEIGVHRGESLAMWAEAFPLGRVLGIDIDLSRLLVCHERVTALELDASDQIKLLEAVTEHGPFDIAIEDSAHFGHVTKAITEAVFPRLMKPGGWFVIEDIHCGWAWRGRKAGRHQRHDHFDYARSMVDAVNHHGALGPCDKKYWTESSSPFDRAIKQVIYRPGLCLMQKREVSL